MLFRMELGAQEGECSCPVFLPIIDLTGREEPSSKVNTTGLSQQEERNFLNAQQHPTSKRLSQPWQ